MPIYEFKCLKCSEFFEMLLMGKDEKVELVCPKCESEEIERVMSATNFAMGPGSNESKSVSAQTRTCSSGSCTTYDVPGYSK